MANDVKIVSMVFETMELGLKHVTEILGEPDNKRKDGSFFWDKNIEERLAGDEEEDDEAQAMLADQFFTSYWRFTLGI